MILLWVDLLSVRLNDGTNTNMSERWRRISPFKNGFLQTIQKQDLKTPLF